jgi:hypothetical protein
MTDVRADPDQTADQTPAPDRTPDPDQADASVAAEDPGATDERPPVGRWTQAPYRYLGAGALYLILSIGLWWHVWSTAPSTVMTCDCTDAGRSLWYFEWSAFALAHGHQLLFSTWLFHPVGFNLLSDTGAPAITLIMSPVTLVFGPVVAINVASTLIPVLTALSMFWLLQRWVRWTPAAFLGGLVYGFGTLVIVQLDFGWLNLACLALLPLMVAGLDELFIRQEARPARVGAALALLMSVEFFVSTEMVLIISISVVVGTILLIGHAWLRHREVLRLRRRYALTGAGVAVVLTSALLAYPVWFVLAGPAHLSGMVWSTNVPGDLGNSAGNFWNRLGQWGPVSSQFLSKEAHVLGGYLGPPSPSPSYLGPGLLVVVATGAVVWRSDLRLRFFAVLGVISAALSLRVTGDRWGPWSIFYHLPVFDNVVQSRFDAVFGLCAAVMLAIIIDRSRSSALRWTMGRPGDGRPRDVTRRQAARRRWAGDVVALTVAAVALVPIVVVLAPGVPVRVQPVTVPEWFQKAPAHLSPGQVVLTYPFATADSQSSIPWQAISGMHYQMAGGGGPAGTVARAGADKVGFHILAQASVPLGSAPAPTRANLQGVRKALRDWGVTMVVVPGDAGLAEFQTGRGAPYGVAFFTAVLGSAPSYQDSAWVWTHVSHRPPPLSIATSAFTRCLARDVREAVNDGQGAECVLRSSSPGVADQGSGDEGAR